MGFLLKLIFFYFLAKFIWSLFRVSVIKKINKKILKEMNKSMGKNGHFYKDKMEPNTKEDNLSSRKDKTFDADYRVLKK